MQERIMSGQLARVVLQMNEFSPQNFGATARFRVGYINSGMAKDQDCHPRLLVPADGQRATPHGLARQPVPRRFRCGRWFSDATSICSRGGRFKGQPVRSNPDWPGPP